MYISPRRPTRTPPSGPSTGEPEAARDIHVLVGEVGYEILSNQGEMATALRTFKWRRQKERVIVQADQVRHELCIVTPCAVSHGLALP